MGSLRSMKLLYRGRSALSGAAHEARQPMGSGLSDQLPEMGSEIGYSAATEARARTSQPWRQSG